MKKTPIAFDLETKLQLEQMAKHKGISMAELIRRLIRDHYNSNYK